jgi:3-oxoacyl-[acyl-carrier-protein] synthase-3
MQILELATALPENEYSTDDLIQLFPCSLPEGLKRNILNLGVSKRRLVPNAVSTLKAEVLLDETSLVDLCSRACERVLEKAGLSAGDIGYFVAAYDANPFLSPGLSQLLVRNIGFDPYIKHINAQGIASTAFPKALDLAQYYLALYPEDHVLICVSGVSSYWFHSQVRSLRNVMEISRINQIRSRAKRDLELRKWVATMQHFLFGDGVVAALVARNGEGLSVRKTVEVTNIGKKDYLAGYARLSALNESFKFGFHSHLGKEIPDLGAKYTGAALKRLLGRNLEGTVKITKKWAVHTGSEKILKALAERHGIAKEKLKESHEVLNEHGNLAGASLPFILERIFSTTKLSEGDIVLMLGYGWGFSASASLLEYEK